MNSGYVLMDASGFNADLTSEEQTIPGLYARCEAAYATGKMIIGTGISAGPYDFTPVSLVVLKSGNNFVIIVAARTFILADDDSVTPGGEE